MAKRVPCQGRAGKCGEKATLYVHAFGQHPWSGFFCDRCMGRVIRLRAKLVRRYRLNVIVRPITDWDRKRRKL